MTFLPLDRVLRAQPGWYAGDFHCHTHHSDGALSPTQLLDVARQEGLDFFAITDHNTTGAYGEFGDPDDVLVIPGLEVTFDQGHFNVFGIEHALPWAQAFCPGPTEINLRETQHHLGTLIQEAATAGLVTSINHPLLPPWAWNDPQTELAYVQCVEIWNDPSWLDNRIANPATVELWTRWLNAGHRITAVGGSDYHRPKPKSGPDRVPERLGTPRTYVYAQELSGRAILEGLRRRQVYMTMGPQLTLTGTLDNSSVSIGQDLGQTGGLLTLHATVQEGYTGTARLVCNGASVAETTLQGGTAELTFATTLQPHMPAWFRLDVHACHAGDTQTLCWAITNPIFSGPVQSPTQQSYGDFVQTVSIEQPADRLTWPTVYEQPGSHNPSTSPAGS